MLLYRLNHYPSERYRSMGQELIEVYDQQTSGVAVPPSIYLLTRSPLSPVAQVIWSRLEYFAARGCSVYAIFHKRQNLWAARKAVDLYRKSFGEAADQNLRLADFREVGQMFEELQLGRTVAWAGKRMAEPRGKDVPQGSLNPEVEPGDFAFFQRSFAAIWKQSPSFAEAVDRSQGAHKPAGKLPSSAMAS